MSNRIREADPERAVLDAVRRVADGNDDSLVLRSTGRGHPWIQLSRVADEPSLLCEGTSNEYRSRNRQLSPVAIARMQSLGWHETSDAPFTRWVEVDTPEKRAQLASLLLRTLVEVCRHDPSRPPAVRSP